MRYTVCYLMIPKPWIILAKIRREEFQSRPGVKFMSQIIILKQKWWQSKCFQVVIFSGFLIIVPLTLAMYQFCPREDVPEQK